MFYKLIENVLTHEECDIIIDYSLKNYKLENIGTYDIMKDKSNLDTTFNKRKGIKFKNDIPTFINLENKILEIINQKKIFSGIIYNNIQNFLFNQYDKTDFLNWHTDLDEIKYNATLTILIQLNDNYDGGEFLYKINEIEYSVPKIKGSMFIFESNIFHKVNFITNGTRYSLNTWPKFNKNKNILI